MASQPPLHVVARGPVRHLVLARPHVHNALNPELIAALHGAVTEAATDHATRAVVISGSGSSFCARRVRLVLFSSAKRCSLTKQKSPREKRLGH